MTTCAHLSVSFLLQNDPIDFDLSEANSSLTESELFLMAHQAALSLERARRDMKLVPVTLEPLQVLEVLENGQPALSQRNSFVVGTFAIVPDKDLSLRVATDLMVNLNVNSVLWLVS